MTMHQSGVPYFLHTLQPYTVHLVLEARADLKEAGQGPA
jgi:hypothetical protein